MPGFPALPLVRILAAGVNSGSGRRGSWPGCGTAPAAGPLRDASPLYPRYALTSHRDIPGSDHDHGSFWANTAHFDP